MFKKKEDKKVEVKEGLKNLNSDSPPDPTLWDLVQLDKLSLYTYTKESIVCSIVHLNNAIKLGHLEGSFGEVCFGIVESQSDYLMNSLTYHLSGRAVNLNGRAVNLKDVVYISKEEITLRKKEALNNKIKELQESERAKVEEIEKLAKQLGELE